MSLCRLYSIHLARPGDWRWTPKERLLVARASGGRSSSRRERTPSSSGPEDDGGSPGSSLWDSNVENVRRRNRSRNGEASAAAPDWLTPRRDWTFNSQENKTGEEWWKSPKNEEEYEEPGEDEDEDEDDEEDEDIDSGELFSSLRWGIPVTFIVLPWLLGNPVILLLGLAAVPAIQKVVGPVVSELWEALLRLSGSKRRRKRKNFDFNAEEEEEEEVEKENAYTSWGGQPYRYKRPDKFTAQPLPSSYVDDRVVSREGGKDVSMGGWEDLEDERRMRMPVRRGKKASKLGWRSKKKEKPLLVRLLVALFPFLRNWGGWLSVFLVFPHLGALSCDLFHSYYVK